MIKEIWKPIKGYEGLYEVSNYGNVRSITRIITDSWCTRKLKGKILKKTIHKSKRTGYECYYVTLSKQGKTKKYLVHRLVGLQFVPNLNNKPQINHIDGNPKNNFYKNLEWCTNAENTQHAYDNGLYKNSKKGRWFNHV